MTVLCLKDLTLCQLCCCENKIEISIARFPLIIAENELSQTHIYDASARQ